MRPKKVWKRAIAIKHEIIINNFKIFAGREVQEITIEEVKKQTYIRAELKEKDEWITVSLSFDLGASKKGLENIRHFASV